MLDEKIFGWNVCEVKSFVSFVLNNKKRPLSQNFSLWAKKNGREAFSVRNYFYKLLSAMKSCDDILNKLCLSKEDLCVLQKTCHFKKDEEIALLENILILSSKMSVRRACFEISGGDKNLMVRNQNKFRKLVKNKKELVESVIKKLRDKGIFVKSPYEEKIVVLPKKEILSKEDINSLFFGLLKLVKDEMKNEIRQEESKEKGELIKRIRVQNSKEKLLLEENKNLKNALFDIEKQIAITNDEKMQKLKSFFQNIKMQNEGVDMQK